MVMHQISINCWPIIIMINSTIFIIIIIIIINIIIVNIRDFTKTNIEALRVQQLFCSPPGSQDCEDLLEVAIFSKFSFFSFSFYIYHFFFFGGGGQFGASGGHLELVNFQTFLKTVCCGECVPCPEWKAGELDPTQIHTYKNTNTNTNMIMHTNI